MKLRGNTAMNQNEAMTRDHEILSVREDIVEQTTVQVCIEDTIKIGRAHV